MIYISIPAPNCNLAGHAIHSNIRVGRLQLNSILGTRSTFASPGTIRMLRRDII